MSMNFDNVALPTQDEDEEYDREDYEREQELHQLLLTGLPDDMLEDSRDISSPELNYSRCSVINGQQIWEQKDDWTEQERSNTPRDKDSYSAEYPLQIGQNGPASYHGYISGLTNCNGQNEEFRGHLGKMSDYSPSKRDQREHLQHFGADEHISNDVVELYKVKYNPYSASHPPKGPFKADETSFDNRLEQMQSKFLDSGEASTEAHQFAQLQILYNARGRQLEEMQDKQEEFAREIRYLNHQLAMIKGEKDGMAISCQELQKLLQDAKEHEVHLEGQIKALESRVQDLSVSEEEALKNQKIAEAAMESMQQQLSELCRSESLTRAREQHETVINALKQKHEESLLVLQQTLDAASIALEEQKDNSKRLEEQVKQLQRQQEEAKVEKAEIINGLTKSLEASQQQCRDLLQTGSIQEITQLQIQLQQVQSAKNISDSMNKALQEELTDLKEQITFYESAAKIDALTKDVQEQSELPMSDSYMDLGIRNGNWKILKFQSTMRHGDSDKMSKDEMIMELKAELERSLSSIRTKRHQVTQLWNETKECQKQIAELKEQLQNAEKMARSHEVRASTLEKQLKAVGPCSSTCEKALREEVEKLQCKMQVLLKEIEDKQQQIEKLTDSEKQFKEANQELYNEMRQMIQDFDQDKQEAIDRCERIHQQHHEDSKRQLHRDLLEQHELEKAQLTEFYKQQISQVNNHLEQLNHEMSGVQECYITICKEKDSLESKLREEMSVKLSTTEQEMKRAFSEEMKKCLSELQAELEEKHKAEMIAAKDQWMMEKETDIELQIERRVVLAKTQWQDEQQKLKDQAMCAIEAEWQLRLQRTVEAIEQKTSSKMDQICQTEQLPGAGVCTYEELKAQLASLKVTLEHQAKEEKIKTVEEASKQLELELQKKHEDNVAKLVETTLTNARCRWLEEMTSLPEYRANLQIEEKKWERKHEQDVAKQVATIIKANDEKWKRTLKGIEKAGSSVKMAELQKNILVLERKLELQKEEAAAVAKAELAQVRAQWNKAKQEEINKIHELNEKDYQAFLAEHRNKLSEVLKETKEEFIRQKNEMLAQKEEELKLCLQQKQQEWSAHQEEQMSCERQQYECELVAEIEHFLSEISKHFGKSEPACFRTEECSNMAKSMHQQVVKVRGRLQKVCIKMFEEILETIQKEEGKLDLQNALRESERQHEKYKTEKEAQLRRLVLSEHQLKQELEHLQQEHERTIKIMQNEKEDLVRRLKENESTSSKTKACLQDNWTSESSCKLIPIKGLEEIRHQYLRAVDKIKGDMMHYIQESKKRAAEMIRTEVLRERQQTARKMRKYYLTCLHQLLTDNGQNDGAEKRIMNAASKLAAMAKALETPLPNRKRDKTETLATPPNVKSSEQSPVISENNREATGSVHMQMIHVEKPPSREDQVRKFKKHRTGNELKARVAHSMNKTLYGPIANNGTPDEEFFTNQKQVNIRKIEGKSGILQKDIILLHEVKAGQQLNDTMSKSKLHKAASVAHFHNSPKYLSQMCLSKAHKFNSTNSLTDRASLYMAHNQDGISPSKCFVHYSEDYVCSKTMTGASNDVQETPERDDDYVSNLETLASCKMDTYNFRQAEGKTCHLQDCSTPLVYAGSSGISKPSSFTNLPHKTIMANSTAQVSPSISPVASEMSSVSDSEHPCISSKTFPVVSRMHGEQTQNVPENSLSTFNTDQFNMRTKPHQYIACTQSELELNDEIVKTNKPYHMKEYSHKKYPSHVFPKVDMDSGFDSPFLNAS